MPFAEYAGFLLYLNRKHDTEKLQKLQNKALRICYDIRNPRDISITELHSRSRLATLLDRRKLQLLSLMYDISDNEDYIQIPCVHTWQAERIVFSTDIVQYDIHKWSPYYVGCNLWNTIPLSLYKMLRAGDAT